MQTNNSTRRRAGGPRSRAGCATCRHRRVKCDEAPGHCLRCTKANLQCEGYHRTPTSKNTQSIILPKPDRSFPLSNIRPTGCLPGETETENRYLRYFQNETTSGFQSAWDWTLWNRLMLQGCQHESFIRYAVVAIGALHKSLRASSPMGQGSRARTSDSMAKLHREFAFLSYGKALNKMQLAIAADPGPRLALIACLLIVCFESHAGNRYKAIAHAKSGVAIREELHRTRRQIVDYNEITEAFNNLDIQISTLNDDRAVDIHEKLIQGDSWLLVSMPDEFQDLGEAKKYWSVIMRRSCHFMATTWRRTDPHSLVRKPMTSIPGSVLTTVGDTIHTTSAKVDDAVRIGSRSFSLELSRWSQAFDSIFARIRRTSISTLRHYVIATMLQIQALTLKITLAGIAFTQEILYDQFHADFKNIVRYAEDVATVRHSNSHTDFWAGSFLVDLGLVAPLFTLLLRCRDPVLRRRAITVLQSWHVECWWDPLMIVSIGRFIMNVEEKGMVGGFIPESSRAILTAKRNCPPQREMMLQCVQRTDGVGGGLEWTENIVSW
ncbi:hypothetical protein DM02DRAFT_618725 [Periconia macrospinosa]|uniref:Zn(2)-C6 fungal-type domain-containing protein n=1 Tax=Periconia macrospinosa TaxID=97972 RepID=A0A2V1D829_9PLEO|nr:hypothetical protein DM02DRAFT_618725 [Periconia macrospinosa]